MKYFLVTIDTERDCSPDWSASNPATYSSIEHGIPSLLQPLFNKYSVVPTYLLSTEVLEQENCVHVLNKLTGKHELGTHLHGELTAPQKTAEADSGTSAKDFSCFYDEQTEFSKLKTLTDLFSEKFGYRPACFRAGRFGAGPSTLRSLEKLGYKVDSSVTPNLDWKNYQGTLRFKHAPLQPYYPDNQSDIARPGSSTVLEVPVSVIGRLFRVPFWLRPHRSNFKKMLTVLKYLERHNRKDVFANMMFHSMEVIPKATPYCQSDEEVSEYLAELERILEEAVRRGYAFIGLGEAVRKVRG